ncbi:protein BRASSINOSTEROID INSENSITIVE 1-like [Impatiens glandulifera]|uniref:protein BRASSINOSTEROID INSENSITIVE 1-like n=1 Tax=Impatiens glandulifera TaxID=253017 RepID=UPI001FB0E10B|nr:protein BRASSINOSTEROID INSENSITIVE 1-like [Impatiens glandulifera]
MLLANEIFFILLLLLQSGSLSIAILHPIDFLALQSIHKSIHDMPGSKYMSSWVFTSDPCNFTGVSCNNDKVVALNLGEPSAGSPGLFGQIDPSIGNLSSLAEFTISPGRINGSLPPSMSNLKNLRFLGISRNYISGEIPTSFGQLKQLQTLDLSYNQLTGKIPDTIGALPELSNVILSYNRLSGSIPSFQSQYLTRLNLNHNDLSGPIPSNSLPSSLEYLSLSKNRFIDPVDKLLTRLTNLNYIDLSVNRFTGCIPNIIFTFPIVNLRLQKNSFDCPIQPVSQVNISIVDLSFNKFSGEISPMFSTVENLYLNNNRFTGEVSGRFVDGLIAAKMKVLYLQDNYLRGIEIKPAMQIPVHSSFCLQHNCMVPPVQTICPLKDGRENIRPSWECLQISKP